MPVRLSKLLLLLILLPVACAVAPPLPLEGVDRTLQPDQAARDIEAARGREVVWGGVIVSSRNLESMTEIELLSFPLNANSLWPESSESAQGRFLLRSPGYLEPLDYAPGRYLVARGRIEGLVPVQVGEVRLEQPVMSAGQIHLFRSKPAESRVRFGFGLILSN